MLVRHHPKHDRMGLGTQGDREKWRKQFPDFEERVFGKTSPHSFPGPSASPTNATCAGQNHKHDQPTDTTKRKNALPETSCPPRKAKKGGHEIAPNQDRLAGMQKRVPRHEQPDKDACISAGGLL